MARSLTPCERIERSILTDLRKTLWKPFIAAVKQYELIREGDRIAVCVSGGKDSMLLAVLMRLLQRHSETPFEAVYLIMDPGYSPENRRRVEENARRLEIPYTLFESGILDSMKPGTVKCQRSSVFSTQPFSRKASSTFCMGLKSH